MEEQIAERKREFRLSRERVEFRESSLLPSFPLLAPSCLGEKMSRTSRTLCCPGAIFSESALTACRAWPSEGRRNDGAT